MTRRTPVVALGLAFVAGCASMPDVEVGYYRPQVRLDVTVVQTGGCIGKDVPFLETDVRFVEFFYRDDSTYTRFPLARLGSGLTKADATFEFFPDGRLKSINGSQTGQADDVLKSFLALSSLMGILGADVNPPGSACETWRELFKEKPVSVIWRGSTSFDAPGEGTLVLKQNSLDSGVLAQLQPIFGRVIGQYTIKQVSPRIQAKKDALEGDETITLVEPALASIQIKVIRGKDVADFTGTVRVPQRGTIYQLPIPRGAWFGSNSFGLVLDESGGIAKLGYGTDTGAAAMLGGITEAYKPFAEESTEARANRVKAEADLIYQQERLAQCRIEPSKCAK